MKLIVQRSLESSVMVNNNVVGNIDSGVVVFVGFCKTDTEEDIAILVRKLLSLRIFEDSTGKMNLSLQDVKGSVLSISQFTLYANTKKGNRPSFIDAMPHEQAEDMYNLWNQRLKAEGIALQTGVFGADMKVCIQNDGPVTMILESRS